MGHTCNFSTWQNEVGGLLEDLGQCGLQSDTFSTVTNKPLPTIQNKQNRKKKETIYLRQHFFNSYIQCNLTCVCSPWFKKWPQYDIARRSSLDTDSKFLHSAAFRNKGSESCIFLSFLVSSQYRIIVRENGLIQNLLFVLYHYPCSNVPYIARKNEITQAINLKTYFYRHQLLLLLFIMIFLIVLCIMRLHLTQGWKCTTNAYNKVPLRNLPSRAQQKVNFVMNICICEFNYHPCKLERGNTNICISRDRDMLLQIIIKSTF